MLSIAKAEIGVYVMSCRPTQDGKKFFLGCTQDFERMFTVLSDRAYPIYKDSQCEESLLVRIYCGPGKDGQYKESVFSIA